MSVNLTSLTNKITAIADNIRALTGIEDAMTLDEIVTALNEVYDIDTLVDGSITAFSSSSLTTIENYTFSYCTSLTSVHLPNITYLGSCACSYCTGLSKFWLPATCTTVKGTTYYWSPFYQCSSSLEIYTDVEDEDSIPSGWSTYWNYYASGSTLTVHYGATVEEFEAA